MKDMLSQAQSTIIGKVAETPDLIHVVYRTDETWRLLLSGDLEAAFANISKAIEAEMRNAEPTPSQATPSKRPVRKR